MANINTSKINIGEDDLILQDADLRSRMVASFQASPDNDHYPTEKLVKDAIDAIDAKMPAIPYNVIDSSSTSTVKTATVAGVTALYDGLMVYLKNNNVASASGCTLNINNLGAKPIYLSTTGAAITSHISKNYTFLFVYNASRISGGCWDLLVGYDSNSTYANYSLGHGYGTCATAEATVAKVVTLASYSLATGGTVAVRFDYAVPAAATMNINSRGAKAIYYREAAITAGIIKAGDIATFIYNGTNYILLAIDRCAAEKTKLSDFTDDLGNNPTHTHSQYLTSHQNVSGKADKVSGATNGCLASLDESGNLANSQIVADAVIEALGKAHSHSNESTLSLIPLSPGSAGQVLRMNSDGTAMEFATLGGGGGASDHNFTHTTNQAVSGSVTVTYAANTRGSRMVSASADLSVSFAVNNGSDNYLWVKNTGSVDVEILINSVTWNGDTVTNVYIPDTDIVVKAGHVCEIGIVCNADGAFITSRSDLSL